MIEARKHWEVVAASAILIAVLGVLDVVFIRQPTLLLSLAPLVFMLIAALFPLTRVRIASSIGAFLVLGAMTFDARLIGLSYPALVVLVLVSVKTRRAMQP